ncbi:MULTISPECIES: nucleoid occlusion factor SlmA [Pseudoalteromonas]|uniref:Nucleoid occlusion factor SlmA n=3 Tax=Pseudoalteromonas TaxID=53246 RepID=A0A0F4NU77_PSEO7|nr:MULTISPECIES: nucleoid occlusion factor SlmA [Pseudoalteromonas]ASD68488.1 nucleoid occlusion factor SlmA [Pseudoalteromonas piscicida]ATD07955.1 TetR/AcrR family transcriptional regulator [Pseudoalteromonas piscicida]AUJ68739.1 Nucleoid occlusion factor SlmA [Pseudoalteromonas sp. NC201]AXR03540.1 nucleoid occlusion factor SlmA [Pseudoalteromonas piscicida]KID37658.1 TetR family transcriptional regulator [Pseudoalteromonas flavipulchra NCIMB 2033 = ATCC BAA-314]
MPATKRSNRKEQILQSLAQMLETSPGQRITTAKLAAEVGVSEAALYRHFPSKARMFEGLIEFIEDTLLSRINLILENEKETRNRIYNILTLLLAFAEKNPGITRILTGDALQGEQERLRERVQSLFEKLETQFKQVLRERKLREGKAFTSEESVLANLFLAFVEGKMNQFVRSDFKAKPTAQFDKQWVELEKIWL